jgi:hypothetical protein
MCKRLNGDIQRLKAQKVAVQRNLEASAKQHAQWRMDREKVRIARCSWQPALHDQVLLEHEQQRLQLCLIICAHAHAGAGAAAAPKQEELSYHPRHAGEGQQHSSAQLMLVTKRAT